MTAVQRPSLLAIHRAGKLIGLAALMLTLAACGETTYEDPPRMIAHAGGIGNNRTSTNSLEALGDSVDCGYRAIEVDLSWTTDGFLVLIHDWDKAPVKLFDRDPGAMSLEQFRSLQSPYGLTHLDLEGLARWLEGHPEVLIITDIKARNVDGLTVIAERYPRIRDQIVPQIYEPESLAAVNRLGFDRTIFTLYKSELPDRRIVEFAAENSIWAVTMPARRAAEEDLPGMLAVQGVPVFAHTINDHSMVAILREKGVHGVYTDWLAPSDERESRPLPGWASSVEGETPLNRRIVPFLPFRMEGMETVINVGGWPVVDSAVRMDIRSSSGATLVSRTVPPTGEDIRVVDIPGLDASRETFGWVEVFARDGVEVELDWMYRDGSEGQWTVAGSSVTAFESGGPGSGVRGVFLAIVNPDDTAHEYRLVRRIGNEVINDDVEELLPNRQLLRIYRNRTDEEIVVSVRGGPMAVQVVRWGPMSRFMG